MYKKLQTTVFSVASPVYFTQIVLRTIQYSALAMYARSFIDWYVYPCHVSKQIGLTAVGERLF